MNAAGAPRTPDPAASQAAAQLCVGKVRHARLRPAQNSFTYGVYHLRLPLRALAARAAAGQRLGNALFAHNRAALLSFHDADHGDGKAPPLEWITGLLRAEGIADADGEVWLHTFPRVLGFVFNPVSFWYCERADGTLRAVVCEVNNTFGERHCYLLANPDGSPLRWGQLLSARKVFHVSPFCAVAGHYRFRFLQAMRDDHAGRATLHSVVRIDHDDEHGPLLQTSISGRAVPLDAAHIARAVLRHPLLTFGVVARIHWQALRLWFKKVPFFRKPAPPTIKVTR